MHAPRPSTAPLFPRALLALFAVPAMVACGGGTSEIDHTAATVTSVRGALTIDAENGGPLSRVPVGTTVAVGAAGLADLSLDSGPRLLLDGEASVVVTSADEVELRAGRVYLDVLSGDALEVRSAQGSLSLADASISAIVEGSTALRIYVVRGEISYRGGDGSSANRGFARAGEELVLTASGGTVEPATLWNDWTGGLVRPGPEGSAAAPGMGVLEARVPDEIGMARWPLVIRRLDVSVRIEGPLAITEVTEEFFNPASDTVEGLYRVSVPEGAVLQRFAVDRNGVMVDGYVREEAAARAAYEALVYRGSTEDPALLEWDAPGSYRARIYPIAPGESRRIAIRYAEWLGPAREGGPLLYRYPMAGGARAPRIGELAFVADVTGAGASRVRAGMDATVDAGRVELRRSDFSPRADLWLELFGIAEAQRGYSAPHSPPNRAPGSRVIVGEADERDYFYLPLRLPERLFGTPAGAAPLDVVVVADVSAGTDRSRLELGRSMVESIAGHLGGEDRLTVVGADLHLRPLLGEPSEDRAARMALGAADEARVEAALDALARMPVGGATDLGASLAEAAALLDPAREGIVIYVGDGAPTVGEMEADALREHLSELPHPVRLYAVAVGGEANLDLLAELTRGGGLAMRVEEHQAAANAALRIFAHASRPVIEGLTIDLGTGIENVFPRVAISAARGEVVDVVGRIRDGAPTSVTVAGTFHGAPFTETLPIEAAVGQDPVDLRLRWAGERLRQQLREGASREEIAELGTRYGLITPYTSYYVPSRTELASMPELRRLLRHRDVLSEPSASDVASASAMALLLGPLSLMGCTEAGAPVSTRVRGADENVEGLPTAASTPTATGPSVPTDLGRPNGNAFGGEVEGEESEMRPVPTMPPATVAPAPPIVAAPMAPAEPSPDMARMGSDGHGRETAANAAAAADPSGPYGGLGGEGDTTAALGALGYGVGGGGSGSGYGSGAGGGSRSDDDLADAPRRRSASRPSRVVEPPALEEVLGTTGEGDRGGRVAGGGYAGATTGATAHTTVLTTIVTTTTAADHARSRCSDASRSSLDDRRALWRERLTQSDSVSSWVETYRNAIRDCEARTPRERRALLNEMIDRAGSIAQMLNLYTYLSDGSARSVLRSTILRRVRTPDDLRLVRARFGMATYTDWALVEQVLARATTPAARLRALRQLVSQQPESFELRLRLLTELEAQGRRADAARLAESLRTDPLADAGVRTAIGEMFLRFGDEDEARRAFSEIVEFAPLDELARRRLGDLYRAHGWFEDAYRQYQTLATIRPDDPTVLLLLASAAAGTGRTDEALRLEQRLMETSAPSASGMARDGIARVAQLWSSVRFAGLRNEAREAGDDVRLAALSQRMRRSGVLTGSGAFRATLTWSHPDARLSLWAAHPSMPLTRPEDLAPEYGIEAFDVAEQEGGAYRIEVRRTGDDRLGTIQAQLVMVWNEGRSDEVVRIVPLTFDPAHQSYGWTVTGTNVAPAPVVAGGAR